MSKLPSLGSLGSNLQNLPALGGSAGAGAAALQNLFASSADGFASALASGVAAKQAAVGQAASTVDNKITDLNAVRRPAGSDTPSSFPGGLTRLKLAWTAAPWTRPLPHLPATLDSPTRLPMHPSPLTHPHPHPFPPQFLSGLNGSSLDQVTAASLAEFSNSIQGLFDFSGFA